MLCKGATIDDVLMMNRMNKWKNITNNDENDDNDWKSAIEMILELKRSIGLSNRIESNGMESNRMEWIRME